MLAIHPSIIMFDKIILIMVPRACTYGLLTMTSDPFSPAITTAAVFFGVLCDFHFEASLKEPLPESHVYRIIG